MLQIVFFFCLHRSDRCVSGILGRRIPSTAKIAIEEQKGTGSDAIGIEIESVNGTATGTGNGIAAAAATRDVGIEAGGVHRSGNMDGAATGSGDVVVPVYHQVSVKLLAVFKVQLMKAYTDRSYSEEV